MVSSVVTLLIVGSLSAGAAVAGQAALVNGVTIGETQIFGGISVSPVEAAEEAAEAEKTNPTKYGPPAEYGTR